MFRNFPLVISRAGKQEDTTSHTRDKPQYVVFIMLVIDPHSSLLYTLPTIFHKLIKSALHLPAAPTTPELLFSNAKHVFNICSVTPEGNLYKHLFIQDMENNTKWRLATKESCDLLDCCLNAVRYKYSDLRMHESVCSVHQDETEQKQNVSINLSLWLWNMAMSKIGDKWQQYNKGTTFKTWE